MCMGGQTWWCYMAVLPQVPVVRATFILFLTTPVCLKAIAEQKQSLTKKTEIRKGTDQGNIAKPASQPASQPASLPASQPASQPTKETGLFSKLLYDFLSVYAALLKPPTCIDAMNSVHESVGFNVHKDNI